MRARRCCPTAFVRSFCWVRSGPVWKSSPGCRCSTASCRVATAFSPRDWHVHELLFGYVPAVVAGFLLTAIPNWTGRLPLQGAPLAGPGAGLAGRAAYAVTLSANIGWLAARHRRCALPGADGRRRRRVKSSPARTGATSRSSALLGLLAAGNLGFHLEAHFDGIAVYSTRLGIAAILMLIMVIGGRIIPSFTRNWLMRREPGRLPAPFGRFDVVCLALSGAGLALWIVVPDGQPTGDRACRGRRAQPRAARPLGRRPHLRRPARPGAACRLRLRAARLPAGRAGRLRHRGCRAPGIHAWTAGAIGHHDARRHEPRQPRPYRPCARCVACHCRRSMRRHRHGSGRAHLRRVASGMERSAAAGCGVAWSAAFLGFASLYAPILCLKPTASIRAPQ